MNNQSNNLNLPATLDNTDPNDSLLFDTAILTRASPAVAALADNALPALSSTPEDSDIDNSPQSMRRVDASQGTYEDLLTDPTTAGDGSELPLVSLAALSRSTGHDLMGRLRATSGRRRAHDDWDAESDSSIPSLQTVSDSSSEDFQWSDEDSEEDEDDDDDDELGSAQPPGSRSSAYTPILTPGMYGQLSRAASEALAADFDQNVDTQPFFHHPFAQGPLGHIHGDLPLAIADMLQQALSSALPESDHERAEMIIKALEVAPEELVRRYEKLRAGHDNEQCEGCAVCQEGFLDSSPEELAIVAQLAELPYHDGVDTQSISSILVFPCPGMHLFHMGCLAPWLERKTTCPTCRHDIDPRSLTLSYIRGLYGGSDLHPTWKPPKGRDFRKWIERQEKRLQTGDVEVGKDFRSHPRMCNDNVLCLFTGQMRNSHPVKQVRTKIKTKFLLFFPALLYRTTVHLTSIRVRTCAGLSLVT